MVVLKRYFPLLLIISGLLLVAGGMFASMPISPVATLDCGCGGQVQCVTKQWVIHFGWAMSLIGSLLVIGGSAAAWLNRSPCRS